VLDSAPSVNLCEKSTNGGDSAIAPIGVLGHEPDLHGGEVLHLVDEHLAEVRTLGELSDRESAVAATIPFCRMVGN
jgi:hypothetical protein